MDNRDSRTRPGLNRTGLPGNLKTGIEALSGHSLDDVRVHYNSSKPAQLQAHAFAQGNHIHLAPGQEQHLPHEAWHVVQQKQGRVQSTRQLKNAVSINDNAGLEREADVMGAKASSSLSVSAQEPAENRSGSPGNVVQRLPLIGNTLSDVVIGAGAIASSTYDWVSRTGPVGAGKGKHVRYSPVLSGAGFGTGMTAVLRGPCVIPGGAAASGAPANSAWTALAKKKTHGGGAFYARLHLLNQDFGGPAEWKNLVPMTSRANNSSALSHLHTVENQVRAALNAGNVVGYRVSPIYGSLGMSWPREVVGTLLGGLGSYIPWISEVSEILYYETMIPTAMNTSWWNHDSLFAVPSVRFIRNWAAVDELATYRIHVPGAGSRPLSAIEIGFIAVAEILKVILGILGPTKNLEYAQRLLAWSEITSSPLWEVVRSAVSLMPGATILPAVLTPETVTTLVHALERYPTAALVLHNVLPDLMLYTPRAIGGGYGGFIPGAAEAVMGGVAGQAIYHAARGTTP